MKTVASHFQVSDVPPATEALPEVPYHQAIFELLSQPLRRQMHDLNVEIASIGRIIQSSSDLHVPIGQLRSMQEAHAEGKAQLGLLEANEQAVSRPIEACCRYHGRLVAGIHSHPLMDALHHAFMDHRPVSLSPDMFWLLICQGVAQHVNANAEQLRSRFVQHSGTVEIVVRRDDFIKGSPENPWDEVIGQFSNCIREYIGSAHDLFMPRFSTTGPKEQIAAEVVLLDAMQSYFKYVLETRCGIPAITLEGTADDWEALADRAKEFAAFDLDWWLAPLQHVLQEFVSAARGNVQQSFWESIYKFQSFSGGEAVTGWIAAFFPYLKDPQDQSNQRNSWLNDGGWRLQSLLDGQWNDETYDERGPSPDSFPGGMARAPFVWKYHETLIDMEFLGGFVGVAQDATTLSLRPEIGWAIRQMSPVRPNPKCTHT